MRSAFVKGMNAGVSEGFDPGESISVDKLRCR